MKSTLSVIVTGKFSGIITNLKEPPSKVFMYDGATRLRTRIENGVISLPYTGQLCYRNLQRYLATIAQLKKELEEFKIRTPDYCLLALAEITRQEQNYCVGGTKPIRIEHGAFWFGGQDLDDEVPENRFKKMSYIVEYEPEPEIVEQVKEVVGYEDSSVVWNSVFSINNDSPPMPVVNGTVGLSALIVRDNDPGEYVYSLSLGEYIKMKRKGKVKDAQCIELEFIRGVSCPRNGIGVHGGLLVSQGVEPNPGPMYTQKRNGVIVGHTKFQLHTEEGQRAFSFALPTFKQIDEELFHYKVQYDPTTLYFVIDFITQPVEPGFFFVNNGKKENVYSLIENQVNTIRYSTKYVPELHIKYPMDAIHVVISGTATMKTIEKEGVEKARQPRPEKYIYCTYKCEGFPDERRLERHFPGETSRKIVKEIVKTETLKERQDRRAAEPGVRRNKAKGLVHKGETVEVIQPLPFDEGLAQWEKSNYYKQRGFGKKHRKQPVVRSVEGLEGEELQKVMDYNWDLGLKEWSLETDEKRTRDKKYMEENFPKKAGRKRRNKKKK